MKNILITGGAGFIGFALSNRLKKNGHNVIIYDVFSRQIHGDNIDYNKFSDLDITIADIRNERVLSQYVNNADIVIHLASETGTAQSMYDYDNYISTNISGTVSLMNAIKNSNTVTKVIIASSRSIYGEGKYLCNSCGTVQYPTSRMEGNMSSGMYGLTCSKCNGNDMVSISTDEDSVICPRSIYASTKYSQENLIMMHCESLGINSVSLRLHNVYGPGQSLYNPYTGLMSVFSTLLLNNQSLDIYEDGKQARDFVYIDDVVDAFLLVIDNQSIGGIFNVTGDSCVDVLTIAENLKKIYNSDSNIVISGNYRVGDIRSIYSNGHKLKERGYKPSVTLDTGLRELSKWVINNISADANYEQSVNIMKQHDIFRSKHNG